MRWLLVFLLVLPSAAWSQEDGAATPDDNSAVGDDSAGDDDDSAGDDDDSAGDDDDSAGDDDDSAGDDDDSAGDDDSEPAASAEASSGSSTAVPVEAKPTATPSMGSIVVLRDRTGGSLNLVRKVSRETEVVRAGNEFPATPDLALGSGDAIRTRQGIAAIDAGGGLRLELGERSQVRFEPGKALIRLGELVVETPDPYTFVVGESTVTITSGLVRVRGDLKGRGVVQVFEGAADVVGPAGTRTITALQSTELGTTADVRPVAAEEREELDASRASFVAPPPTKGLVASGDRAHIIIGGGIARIDRSDFGMADISTRVRIAGPAWFHAAFAFAARPADELDGYDAVITLPVRMGVRFLAELPRSIFIFGGADFSLLFGDRCTSLDGCPRQFSVEPGGWLDVGVGLYLHERVGLQIELSGGLYRRRLPPATATGGDIISPELQAQGLVGFFVRL